MRLAGQTGAGFHIGRTRRRRRVKRRKQLRGRISVYPRTTQTGGRMPAGVGIRTQRGRGIGAKMHWKMRKKGSNFTKQYRLGSHDGKTWQKSSQVRGEKTHEKLEEKRSPTSLTVPLREV